MSDDFGKSYLDSRRRSPSASLGRSETIDYLLGKGCFATKIWTSVSPNASSRPSYSYSNSALTTSTEICDDFVDLELFTSCSSPTIEFKLKNSHNNSLSQIKFLAGRDQELDRDLNLNTCHKRKKSESSELKSNNNNDNADQHKSKRVAHSQTHKLNSNSVSSPHHYHQTWLSNLDLGIYLPSFSNQNLDKSSNANKSIRLPSDTQNPTQDIKRKATGYFFNPFNDNGHCESDIPLSRPAPFPPYIEPSEYNILPDTHKLPAILPRIPFPMTWGVLPKYTVLPPPLTKFPPLETEPPYVCLYQKLYRMYDSYDPHVDSVSVPGKKV